MKIDLRELITEQVLKNELSFVVLQHIDTETWFGSHETFDTEEHYDPAPVELEILKHISLTETPKSNKHE